MQAWQSQWDKPLTWPRPVSQGSWDVAAHIERRKAVEIDPRQSALVLVDFDKKAFDLYIEDFGRYAPALGEELAQRIYAETVPNAIRLVDFFRSKQRPVVFVQWDWHRHQYPPLEPREGEPVVYKWATGAFNASGLDAVLRRRGVGSAFFAGSDTSFCLESTVRGAVDCRYQAVVVEDACMSCLQRLHESTLLTLGWHLAFITTTDQVVEHYPWDRLPGVPHELLETLKRQSPV